MIIKLKKSSRKDKKYMAIFEDGKKVHFGAKGYSDFTKHKDPERKERYIARHRINEDWEDIKTQGTWSRWILWNKPTLVDSIRDMEDKFGVNIINNT